MDKKSSPNFAIGFLIGLLLCVILWYWQKSTAAEDGALDLLDRYAGLEKRLRGVGGDLTTAVSPQPEPPADESPFDFRDIKGIGPVFNRRLQEAGIVSLADLTALPVDTLAAMLDITPGRAQNILVEAQKLPNA